MSEIATQHSQVYEQFEANLRQVTNLVALLSPKGLHHSISLFGRRVNRYLSKKGSLTSLKKGSESLGEAVGQYVAGRQTLQNWFSVILVAFGEAYLEDGLVVIASHDPSLVKNVPVPSQAILTAESLDTLRNDIRRQWAQKFLRGGPRRWLPSLKSLGAKGFEKHTDFRLEHLWDTRNLVVHAGGVISRDYAMRYPNPPLNVGEPVKWGLNMVAWWAEGLNDLVKVTDHVVMKRRVSAGAA